MTEAPAEEEVEETGKVGTVDAVAEEMEPFLGSRVEETATDLEVEAVEDRQSVYRDLVAAVEEARVAAIVQKHSST